MNTPLNQSESDRIRYVSGQLFTLGSEDRGLKDRGWDGQQRTGDRHVVAFSLRPVEVHFEGESPVILAPTTIALVHPNCAYTRQARSDRGQRTLFLSMDERTLRSVLARHMSIEPDDQHDLFPMRFGPSDARSQAMAIQLDRLLLRDRIEMQPLEFDELAMGIVDQAIGAVIRHKGDARVDELPEHTKRQQRGWVDDAIARLCQDSGRQWTLNELADSVDLSPAYLSRLFRKHTGHTLSQTLTIVRLIRVIERLPDMRGSLTRLAVECGFSSHAHMSTAFQSVLQLSPSTLARSDRASRSEVRRVLSSRLRVAPAS